MNVMDKRIDQMGCILGEDGIPDCSQASFARTMRASPLWKDVMHLAVRRSLPRGTVVMPAGEQVNALYYVEQGEVRIDMHAPGGMEKIFCYIGPDCLFGESPFFLEKPYFLSATCVQPTILQVFTREVLNEKIFPKSPELVQELFRALAFKLQVLINQIALLGMDPMVVRVCKYLRLNLSRDDEGRLYSVPGIPQHELANLLGMHRVSCNRILKGLEKEGVISEYSPERVWIYREDVILNAGMDLPCG